MMRPLAAPSAASEYSLHERIGRGSFGTVYRATPRDDGDVVAIKIIELEEMADEIEDLQAEIGVLSQASCPQLISYVGSDVVGASVWIVMEYLEVMI